MALAIDGSTPAKATSAAFATVTTAAFSPPANAQLAAFCVRNTPTAGGNADGTVTSTGGLSWSLAGRKSVNAGSTGGAGTAGCVEIWVANTTSAPGSITVTSTRSSFVGGPGDEQILKVEVYTGAEASWAGAIAAASSASGLPSVNETTTQANSWVFACSSDWAAAGLGTVGSNQTMIDEDDVAGQYDAHIWRQTSTTPSSGTSVTSNLTAPSAQQYNVLAIEIREDVAASIGSAPPQIPPPLLFELIAQAQQQWLTGTAAAADVTATPPVVAGTTAIPTPTVSATAVPAVVSGTTTIPNPTVAVTAAPPVVAGTTSIPSPTVQAIVTPAVVAGSTSIPTPTVTTGTNATATPSVVSATTTIPTPTVLVTVTPAVVAAAATIPAPTVKATVTPSVVAAVATVPAPTVAVTAIPAVVAGSTSIPTPTVTASGNATASPSAVAGSTSIPAPVIKVTVLPTVVAGSTSIPTARLAVTPTGLALAVTIPAPTIRITAAPPVLAAIATIPTPTVVIVAAYAPILTGLDNATTTAGNVDGTITGSLVEGGTVTTGLVG